jgi:hypothetical protein
MAATPTPTQPTRHLDSERERERRRDRHVRLATDRALTEVTFKLRARERQHRRLGVGRQLEVHEQIRAPERARQDSNP